MDTTLDFTYCYDCNHLIPYMYPDGKVLYFCDVGRVVIGWVKPKIGRKHPVPRTTKCKPEAKNPKKPNKKHIIKQMFTYLFGFWKKGDK